MKVYEISVWIEDLNQDIAIWIATDHKILNIPTSEITPTIKEIDVKSDAPGVDLIIV